jgi:hypothetical protein
MNPELKVILGYDVDQSTINKVNASFEEMGKRMQKIGTAMTLAVTAPLLILAKSSLTNYDVQAKAIAQVEAGLKSTGSAIGYTSKQLQQLASDIQGNSLFGDEVILRDVTAQLLTFTNIAGEQFARTQVAAADLASRLGGDLKSASIQLGKALNDPVTNLSALSRSGIQFTASQKGVIKALTESGRLAEAQTIILDELEKQYGGSAKAAAEAGTGWITQLNNSYGDLLERFGEVINEGLKPFGAFLSKMVSGLQKLSPEAIKTIVIIGGIAAAMGPLLVVVGSFVRLLPLLKGGLASMRGAMMAVMSPVGLVVAGIIALAAAFIYVRDNLQAFKERFANIWINIKNGFIDVLKSMITPYAKFATLLGMDIGQNTIAWLDSFREKTKAATTEFGSFGRAFKNAMKDVGLISDSPIGDIVGGDGSLVDTITPATTGASGGGSPIDLKDKTNFGVIDLISKQGTIDKFKTTLGETLEGVKAIYSEKMTAIAADMALIQGVIMEAINMGIGAIGDTLSLGFASMFNKNIDFKKGFKQILGNFLSGLGDMVMAMALKLQAVAALKTTIETAIAGVGTGGIALIAAAGLFALGAAMKGGGMALSNASGVSGSNSSFQGGGSSGSYGTQPIRVTFENGALQGYMNAQTQRRGR